MDFNYLKEILEEEYQKRNNIEELSNEKPDPLMVAREYGLHNEYIILTCALFAYGNAKQIVKFLKTLPFDLFDRPVSETTIRNKVANMKYRFQSNEDIVQWFITLQNIRKLEKKAQINREPKKCMLHQVFIENYNKNQSTIEGIYSMMDLLYNNTEGYSSRGFNFLIGKKNNAPLKRWHMFLRWMVRNDNLDLGIWTEVNTKDLIIPLDTHLFNIGKKLDLITNNKTYNLKAAIEITENLKKLEPNDPLKYDFVIYRLGQEKLIN